MNFKALFEQFNGVRILVVGDVMIDSYLRGKVNRVSPEAPVPIVSLDKEEDRLGGAANVAVNLVAMGASPIICSVVGSDKQGNDLKFLLDNAGISSQGVVYSHTRKTTVKTRVIGNNQQLLRIDSEQTDAISKDEEELLIRKVKELIGNGIDGIIFEDYNKGVLTPRVIKAIIELANENNVPTTVDPKKDNFFAYRNVTLFKPNLKELKEGLGVNFSFLANKNEFESAVNELEKQLNNSISFVTLSEHGVFIKKDNAKHYAAAHIRTISDVSGAGDTVISVATLCLVAGLSLELIAEVSNIAGGLVCEKSGVVSIDKDELLTETERLLNN
jgi:rfaE bifunctional protein kinase chain/domain